MVELFEVLDLLADSGLEGAVTWLFRILGVLSILAGIGIWLFTEITLLVPIVLIVAGLLLELAEIAG